MSNNKKELPAWAKYGLMFLLADIVWYGLSGLNNLLEEGSFKGKSILSMLADSISN